MKHSGFSLVEVMIVAAIIAVLAAMALPNFNRMRANTYYDRCLSNLKRIAMAKEQWSYETGAADTDTPTAAQLDTYLKDDIWDEGSGSYTTGHDLTCMLDPQGSSATFGTSYNINDISTEPTCKIDAAHVLP